MAMATFSRFLSVICLSPFMPSLCATAETTTIRSDTNRPVSERTRNRIDKFDDSSCLASRPMDAELVIGKQRLGKRLLQNGADTSSSGEHYETTAVSQNTEGSVNLFRWRVLLEQRRSASISRCSDAHLAYRRHSP